MSEIRSIGGGLSSEVNHEKKESLGGGDFEFDISWDRFRLFRLSRSHYIGNCPFYFRLCYFDNILQTHSGDGGKTLVLGLVNPGCFVVVGNYLYPYKNFQ